MTLDIGILYYKIFSYLHFYKYETNFFVLNVLSIRNPLTKEPDPKKAEQL